MLSILFDNKFKKEFSKLDKSIKEKVIKQIEKLNTNPETGKLMRYTRKGTRELYISPFRLSYSYIKEENRIIILALYHKKGQ